MIDTLLIGRLAHCKLKIMVSRLTTELEALAASGNLRSLPQVKHDGKWIEREGRRMLNLSSNDYLGLAADVELRKEFLEQLTPETFLPTSSSSRLLTGNFSAYDRLETLLVDLYHKEAALVFNCGYHANNGILPALCDKHCLIVADKLVHASLIDGLRLGTAPYLRFPHNDYERLEKILAREAAGHETVVVVVESIYSMDGDRADLARLVELKKQFPNVWLYVDEAHGVGAFGETGLGLAEETGTLADIDLLVGTFGKALASAGAFVVCSQVVRQYLINKMRPFIFTTALPPVTVEWTEFIVRRLSAMTDRREHLRKLESGLAAARSFSRQTITSQIVPFTVGESSRAVRLAEALQHRGFYVLPVRPPTVPAGTSRLRFSLTAALSDEEVKDLARALDEIQSIN